MAKVKSTHPGRSKAPLWGLLYLGVGLVLVNGAITHYLAFYFHFHPALGKPIYAHFYNPFAWLFWQWKFYKQAKTTFNWSYLASFIGFGLVFLTYSTASHLN